MFAGIYALIRLVFFLLEGLAILVGWAGSLLGIAIMAIAASRSETTPSSGGTSSSIATVAPPSSVTPEEVRAVKLTEIAVRARKYNYQEGKIWLTPNIARRINIDYLPEGYGPIQLAADEKKYRAVAHMLNWIADNRA